MKYVALLRGINVGGNNKISMKQLVTGLERTGFKNVSTYINSGNVFFEDNSRKLASLQKEIEAVITAEFGLNIKALVLSQSSLNVVAAAIPSDWSNDSHMKCDIMFLWDKYTSADVMPLLPVKPGIDTVKEAPGAIIWGIERSKATRSGLPKLIGTHLYAHMTIRNCNTVRKIQQLMS